MLKANLRFPIATNCWHDRECSVVYILLLKHWNECVCVCISWDKFVCKRDSIYSLQAASHRRVGNTTAHILHLCIAEKKTFIEMFFFSWFLAVLLSMLKVIVSYLYTLWLRTIVILFEIRFILIAQRGQFMCEREQDNVCSWLPRCLWKRSSIFTIASFCCEVLLSSADVNLLTKKFFIGSGTRNNRNRLVLCSCENYWALCLLFIFDVLLSQARDNHSELCISYIAFAVCE